MAKGYLIILILFRCWQGPFLNILFPEGSRKVMRHYYLKVMFLFVVKCSAIITGLFRFCRFGAGISKYKGYWGTYIPAGAGIQINFFDEAYL